MNSESTGSDAHSGFAEKRRLDLTPLSGKASMDFWTPEGLKRLRRLYEAELGGSKLDEVDVEDAWALTNSLTWQLMHSRRWQEAEPLFLRLASHPDLRRLDSILLTAFQRQLGFCALALGREEEGLRLLEHEIDSPDPKARWTAERDIRNTLGWGPNGSCPVLWRDGLASEAMTTFIEKVVARLQNRAPKRNRFARRTSYAKLRRHLLNAFGGDLHFRNTVRGMTSEEVLRHAKESCEEVLAEIRLAGEGAHSRVDR